MSTAAKLRKMPKTISIKEVFNFTKNLKFPL